jgi:hypothetical protein
METGEAIAGSKLARPATYKKTKDRLRFDKSGGMLPAFINDKWMINKGLVTQNSRDKLAQSV